jgi:SAM-dependent methyltransferase
VHRKAKDMLPAFCDEYVRARKGRTLIVGSKLYDGRKDRRGLYANALGIDMQDGQGVDQVVNLEDGVPKGFGTFSHIECCSVLEHARQPWLLAASLEQVLEPGGTLTVSVPWVWRFHGYPNDYWRFTPEGLKALFPGMAWNVIRLAIEGQLLEVPPVLPTYTVEGTKVAFPRTEILAFGVRCTS